jgi:hypothetical protein
MTTPLVSVCIPNYNYARYVDACLGSVLAQSYPELEIVFVDNASTDASVERAKAHGERVQVHVNPCNLGMVRNFNRAFELSRGEYLVFLSTDDALMPDFAARCVGVLEAHRSAGLVVCEREEIDAEGRTLDCPPFFYDQSCLVPSESQLPVLMMTGMGVPCQVMFRRSVFAASGGFSERFSHTFDWHSNFRCVLHADLVYLRERLAKYRVFPGNSTAAMTRNLGMSMEHYLLLLELRDLAVAHGHPRAAARFPEALARLGMMCLRYSVQMLHAGERDAAERYLFLARAYHPPLGEEASFGILSRGLSGELGVQEVDRRLLELGFSRKRVASHAPPEGFRPLASAGAAEGRP